MRAWDFAVNFSMLLSCCCKIISAFLSLACISIVTSLRWVASSRSIGGKCTGLIERFLRPATGPAIQMTVSVPCMSSFEYRDCFARKLNKL